MPAARQTSGSLADPPLVPAARGGRDHLAGCPVPISPVRCGLRRTTGASALGDRQRMTGLRVCTHSTARLRRWSMLTSVALVLTAAGLLAHPIPVLAWDGNSFSAADEQELVTLTNQARASAGLRALRVDSTLTPI